MSLAPLTRIGPYEVQSLLGSGGMGEVYKARDTRLHRAVALKVLRATNTATEEQQARFLQEARAASALQHPRIITVHDVLTADGTLVIVLEHVSGRTLDQIIPKKGMRVTEVLRLAVQIADALAAAHGAGIVHRDLKPSNIMVDEQGSVKLLDFGLAKLMERTRATDPDEGATELLETTPVTERGVIMGTACYMSPEQAEGKPVDARSDVFSFGCVLYEMLTGQRAFRRDSAASTLSAILRDDPPAPTSISPDIPHDLERIVQRSMRKDPARRWQNMSDLRVALEELKEESASGRLPVAAVPAIARPRSRKPAFVVAAVALIIAAIGASWFAGGRRTGHAALSVVPLTSNQGFESHPSFSPDGTQVAYAWDGAKGENFDIYVKVIGAGEPLRLTTDPADHFAPAWSPDGRQIAFLRVVAARKRALMLMPALGGSARKVGEVVSVIGIGRALTWSPDGKWLITTVSTGDDRPAGLTAFSTDTGEAKHLTSPPPNAAFGDLGPDVSPDGRTVVFGRTASSTTGELYILPVSADMTPLGDPKQLTKLGGNNVEGTWSPDGRTIVFGSNRATAPLWRMRAEPGAAPEQLPVGAGGAPMLSRRGNRLTFTRADFDSNLWRLDITRTAEPSPVLTWTSREMSANISPDGKRIAFASYRSGSMEVWTALTDGSQPVQLTSFGKHAGTPRWSPDGSRIVFDSNASGAFQLYVATADGGAPRQLTQGPEENSIPTWSADGRWIYFSSLRTGRFEIWKMRPDGSGAEQVTRNRGRTCAESQDGKWVYFMKEDRPGPVWRIPSGGGPEQISVDAPVAQRGFATGSSAIYYLRHDADRASVVRYDPETRLSRNVGVITKPLNLGFALSPDETYVIYTQTDRSGSNIMVVDNFR